MASVIVADNDALVRGVLRSVLIGVGQTVFLATCGEEALTCASRVHARLVLLDLNMPRLNGFLACEQLRRLPGYENTPIVILSAHDGERERDAAARVGMTLFLTKPFQPAVLLQSLSPYLDMDATTQKAILQAATRAREIMPLGGRILDWDNTVTERDHRALIPAPEKSEPSRSVQVIPRRPEIAGSAAAYVDPPVDPADDDGAGLGHSFRWLVSRAKAGWTHREPKITPD
jgi:two-component system chemotaxis response regulator CheY